MRTRLAAPDINCAGCKAAIEAALAAVPGVEAVEVDVSGRVVDVVHDPAVDAAALARLMEDTGYQVAAAEEVG
ncbi:MAG: heavy-metal-associated domain-containing protein [Thermoleophilaceae bacterium]